MNAPACNPGPDRLHVSSHSFKEAFECTPVALAILDAETLHVSAANPSFFDLLGRPSAALVGQSLAVWPLTTNQDAQAKFQAQLVSGQAIVNQEIELRRPGGEIRTALWSVAPIRTGGASSLLLTLVDVTEQRSLEMQLRQSQKMDAIGQIAAGVAHDFNNLLTVIIGHADLQLGRPGVDAANVRSFQQIKGAGARAASLTRQLLAFSRKQVTQLRPLDPGKVVRNMDKMLKRLGGKTVEIKYAVADSLPAILADESNLEQVLLNLVVNARDAMPSGGAIHISLQPVEVDQASASRNPEARAGRFVQLSVQDNGVGMDSETLRRIFEPFFTTKPVGKGTGLGLSTVYGIVKQHNGWVEVQSSIGEGAVFRVYFPVTNQSVSPSAVESAVPNAPLVSATVLVVEDEPQVRDFVCAALRSVGLKVLDAECGKSAMQVWKAFGDSVNLLLVNTILPDGLSGNSLAKILKAQSPDLRVVYTCGVDEDNATVGQIPENADFLQKPFGRSDLLNIIQKALNQTFVAVLS